MQNDELLRLLAQWKVPGPPADLARRIVREAVTRPQHLPLGARLGRALERALTEWRYGLATKAGALALCAVLGLGLGRLSVLPGGELDLVALALAQEDSLSWL